MIISRTPLRICLAGGGTDLPSYYSEYEGIVVSMAIDKHIYITYKPDDFDQKVKLRYSTIEVVDNPYELKNTRAKALLCAHGVGSCEINTSADIPSNTGLGSSGSFLVGLSHCVRERLQIDKQPNVLAEEACHIEIDVLKEPVGKQDQYIAAYGGTKIFSIDKNGHVKTSPLIIPNQNILIENMRLYYLNVKRDASEVLAEQSKMQGNTASILHKVKEMAYESIRLLSSANFDQYGRLLDEYWTYKKQLSNKISLAEVDIIYQQVKDGYDVLGGKIIGGGGGGFLLLYCPQNHNALDDFMVQKGYKRLSYSCDTEGSKILGNF